MGQVEAGFPWGAPGGMGKGPGGKAGLEPQGTRHSGDTDLALAALVEEAKNKLKLELPRDSENKLQITK